LVSHERIFVDGKIVFFSVYSATIVFGEMGWSAMKVLKRREAASITCGTLAYIVDIDDKIQW
jgi:hypothetical protein